MKEASAGDVDLEGMGVRLAQERKRLGMTQQQLADRVGLSRPAQATYEGGKAAMDVKYIELARRSGLDMDFVVRGQRGALLAADLFDWKMGEDLFVAVSEKLNEARANTTAGKLFKLFQLLYSQAATRGVVDDETVEVGVRLLA